MGAASGPDMITDGLVLCLDAGSRASYSVTNILSYWTEYAGRAVHYEVLDAYSVKLKNTFNSWVGYYPATITSTGRYTITFTYYSDTNGSSLYLDNDGVMDNIYNNYTLTANIASQTYTASVDINTTGAINFYFMRFSGGNIFITDVNFYKSDTIWTDLAGSNNGTLTNGPTFSSANGGSIVFDGSNDYVERNTALNVGSNFSVFAWVKPGAIDIRNGIVGNSYLYSSGVGWYFSTATNYGGTLNTFFISVGTDNAYRIANNSSITLNAWNYMGGIVTNGGQDIKLYVNGIETSYITSVLTSNTVTYTTPQFYVGRRIDSAPESFIGSIAQTQIYNRVLTPAEIQQNYNALKGRFGL